MANIDLNNGTVHSKRPQAIIESNRSSGLGPQAAPRRTSARPKYCRIDSGQFIRALFLVALSFGAIQLSGTDKGVQNGGESAGATARPM
jgi:hypothetical protein